MQLAAQKLNGLLSVTRSVGHVRESTGRYVQRYAPLLRIQPDINLIFVKVRAGRQQGLVSPKLIRMDVLCVETLLITRIMLLDAIAVDGIIQKQREVGVKIKKRSAQESDGLKTV